MIIPDSCINLIAQSLMDSGFVGKVSPEDPEELAAHYLDPKRLEEQIQLIETYAPLRGEFLEIGSGFGGLVTYLNNSLKWSCNAYGVEPAADAYTGTLACTVALARANAGSPKVAAGFGEVLPFRSESFDIVYSTSVLEHVNAPDEVLAEAIRVLKPGGLLQFVVPNYGSWWEGHYGVLVLPHMPKWLFKQAVKCLGRDPGFVDTLKFITKGSLKKMLASHEPDIEILSWGRRLFEHRLQHADFSEWASLGRLKKWITLLHKLGLIRLGIGFCRVFNWQTPIVLTLRERNI